jgi:hypothetical protein
MKLTPWLLLYIYFIDSSSHCHRRSRYVILLVRFLYIVTKPGFIVFIAESSRMTNNATPVSNQTQMYSIETSRPARVSHVWSYKFSVNQTGIRAQLGMMAVQFAFKGNVRRTTTDNANCWIIFAKPTRDEEAVSIKNCFTTIEALDDYILLEQKEIMLSDDNAVKIAFGKSFQIHKTPAAVREAYGAKGFSCSSDRGSDVSSRSSSCRS